MHGTGRRRARGRPQIFGLEEYILKSAISLEGTFDLGAELKTSTELVGRGARIANIETLPLLSLSQEAGREAVLGLGAKRRGGTEAPWRDYGSGRWGSQNELPGKEVPEKRAHEGNIIGDGERGRWL